MMAAKGLPYPKDYNLINVGPSAQSLLALTANRVDAALIAVPLSSDAAEMGYNVIGGAADIIPHYQLTEVSSLRGWAEKNRPVMVRFMKGMVLAMRWLYDNKEPAIEFLAEEMKSSRNMRAAAGNITQRIEFGILMPKPISQVSRLSFRSRPSGDS
jgi:ABC-type nitrate/sulfonate/bicarbonate transport system substrate-binding protein